MILDTTKPSPAQVDALLEEWRLDAKIDKLEPADEIRKIPTLHAKYVNILSVHRRAFKEGERRISKLKRLKYEYYNGKLDQETMKKLEWPPFLYTLKSGELPIYLESDKELLHAKAVQAVHEEIMDIAERIIKELGSRTYQLKDIISWEKFISGAH
jgi:flagellar motor switch/type III secretory pathway protein FliN